MLIKLLYIIWVLVGRFVFEGRDAHLLLDSFYVLLSLLVFWFYKPTNTLLFIALVSIYTLYNDALNTLSISPYVGFVSAIGTLITFFITFKPARWSN